MSRLAPGPPLLKEGCSMRLGDTFMPRFCPCESRFMPMVGSLCFSTKCLAIRLPFPVEYAVWLLMGWPSKGETGEVNEKFAAIPQEQKEKMSNLIAAFRAQHQQMVNQDNRMQNANANTVDPPPIP